MVALIVVAVVVVVRARHVWRGRSGSSRRRAPASSSGSAATRRTLTPGLALVVPFVDRIRPLIDLREQVVSFPPQPVITEDNLVVSIDTVIYFQVTDAEGGDVRDRELHPGDRAAHRDDAAQRDRRHGAREDAHLARRDQRPAARRARRGDRQVGHPRQPRRAEGDRPARLDPGLDGEADARRPREARRRSSQAEGEKQSAILTAEGEKQAAILRAEGQRQATILAGRGPGEGDRHRLQRDPRGQARPELLAYQYLQMLPQIAQGESNKVWIIPSEFQQALGRIAGAVKDLAARSPRR